MSKTNQNPKVTKDFKVYFNSNCVFSHIDFTICVEFAVHLHRSSNQTHKIDIVGDHKSLYSLFERDIEL